MKYFNFTLLVISSCVYACLWDEDTIRDELQNKTGLYDLVVGQIPHHGEAYYKQRIKNSLAKLAKTPDDINVKNNLAVAYIRLKQFDLAEKQLLEVRDIKFKHYQTLSNLGVLYKKKKDYYQAARYIKAALKIRPKGHMGLGDWYLRMLYYRGKWEGRKVPDKNFLHQPYKAKFRRFDEEWDEPKRIGNRALKLIQNDQGFADGFLLLGDLLVKNKSDLNLAFRAYVRALILKHDNPNQINRRINYIVAQWRKESDTKKTSLSRESLDLIVRARNVLSGESFSRDFAQRLLMFSKQRNESGYIANAILEILEARDWSKRFVKVESFLVAKGKMPDFQTTLKEMKKLKIKKYRSGKTKKYRWVKKSLMQKAHKKISF